MRAWDIGKEGVSAEKPTDQDDFKEKLKIRMEKKIMTQQEWVTAKRKERNTEFAPKYDLNSKKVKLKTTEFAPPSHYEPAAKRECNQTSKYQNKTKFEPPRHSSNLKDQDSRVPHQDMRLPPPLMETIVPPPKGFNPGISSKIEEFDPEEPLPPGYDFQHTFTSQNLKPGPSKNKTDVDRLHLHKQFNPTHHSNDNNSKSSSDQEEPLPPGYEIPSYNISNSKPCHSKKVSLEDRLNLHEKFNPKPIENELTNFNTESSSENEYEDEFDRPKRAEIAPPSMAEYYNTKQMPKQRPKGLRTHEQMAEAFLCGLKSNFSSKTNAESEEESD